LSIMQKRAKDIGGSVSVQGDDTGTRVFLEIPLPAGQTATNHADAYLA